MLSLLVRQGAQAGTTYRLGTRVLTLGRDPQNAIQVVDGEVSRRHALIRWNGSSHVITDLKSHNGTFVGTALLGLEEHVLVVGEQIRVGGTVLEVVPDERGARDAVLAGKNVRNEVRLSTIPSARGAGAAGGGNVVDLDAEIDRRAMRVTRLAASLKDAIRSGRHRSLVFKQALLGVLGLLGADRTMVVRVGASGALETDATASADECGARETQPEWCWDAIRLAATGGVSVLVGSGDEESSASGSVLAVPILEGARVVGVLYADAVSRADVLFVRPDTEVLEVVARALVPTLTTSARRGLSSAA